MEFLRDYLGVLPGIIAVINGGLAALLSHYPFKTPAGKLRFIVIVGLLSVSAIAATLYSQHLVIAQRTEERAQRDLIRNQLGHFIAEGTNLLNLAGTASAPVPAEATNDWANNTETFLAKDMGSSTAVRLSPDCLPVTT